MHVATEQSKENIGIGKVKNLATGLPLQVKGRLAHPHLLEVHLVNIPQGIELTGGAAANHAAACF